MIKSNKFRSTLLTGLLFIFLLLVLLVKIRTGFNFYDEGFAMFGPIRILAGEIPYKDFWAIYPPGQFYAVAALIKLFGPDLINARIYDTLIRIWIVIGCCLIAWRIASPRLALLSAVVITFLLGSAGFYSYAVFPAMGLGIWAIWAWLKYAEKGKSGWLLLAGSLIGIAMFIRWDIGAYGGLSALVGCYLFMLYRSLTAPQEGDSAPVRINFHISLLFKPLAPLALLYGPMLAIAVAAYGLVGLQSGWQDMYEQVFYFPIFVLHSVRWLAYPALIPRDYIPDMDWLRFYFPLFTFGVTLVTLILSGIKKRASLDQGYFAVISLLIFGGLLFNQALSRYDMIHVTPASILTFLLAAALAARVTPTPKLPWVRYPFYALLFCLTALYFPPALQEQLNTLDNNPPWRCYSDLPRASCVAVSSDQERAVAYIQAHTAPGEAIFVGNQKHSSIFVSDIGFYYLAERPSASRYHELYPSVATTLPVQQTIANELESKKVGWLVLAKIWDSTEPNDSALDSGVVYLDDYIRRNYTQTANFGMYRIMRRDPN
jgi:hypothetical protein